VKSSRFNRPYLIVSFVTVAVFFLAKCMEPGEKKTAAESAAAAPVTDYTDFAGSGSCASCHQDVYNTHLHTAHFLTSAPATDKYIKGSFDTTKNTFAFSRSVIVRMEKRDDGFYQVEYADGVEKKAKRMDIVIGSGTMGQSSLTWQDNYLVQMPITYFTAADQWSNSPGFPPQPIFNRLITSRCLECHVTYAGLLSEPDKEPEQFDKNKFIYGVDCEKCHGPAAKHVQFQQRNQKDTTAKFISNPKTFTRQQKLDLCTLCHGGIIQKTKPSFSYQPGDKLSDFFIVDSIPPNPQMIDVHGNQYGLLRSSKCFIKSEMTCNICHDTHRNEKGQTKLFSQRCMNCHTDISSIGGDMHRRLGAEVKKNCVDCHMPLSKSRAIAVFLPGKDVPTAALIRSHYIKVYDDESKKLADFIKGKSN
jgi:hypothetical protein